MSPNLTAIAEEFGFSETSRDQKLGGDISLAFFLLGAPASFFVGCLADQYNRAALFAWTVAIGEGACFATYFSSSYRQLYLSRAITGFSVGGALPLIYSILGDLFASEDRHIVSAVVSFGTGAGISVGQAIAGFLGPTFGWRLPFLVVSVPALLCALAVLLFVEDPERGGMEKAFLEQKTQGENEDGISLVAIPSNSGSTSCSIPPVSFSDASSPTDLDVTISGVSRQQQERTHLDQLHDQHALCLRKSYAEKDWCFCGQNLITHITTLQNLLITPTVLLALVQGAPGCIPWGIINVFLNDYLSEDRGFSVEVATSILMCFSLGHVFGLLLGGGGGRYLYQQDVRYPSILAGSMAIIGCIPFWMLLNRIDSSAPYFTVAGMALLSGFGSGPTGPIIKATLTNVTLPRSRGQAFALFNLFDDFGKGLGPYFVAILITQMGGRLPAFNIGVLGWIVCGLANLITFWTVRGDEDKVQIAIAASLQSTRRDSSIGDDSELDPNSIFIPPTSKASGVVNDLALR